jgi:hypothetical protein
MQDSVTVPMNATPQRVWELVSDVTRVGEFSPETFEGRWCDGATGPAVGAKFQGHVRRNGRGPVYWTDCRVTASDPGREFAFVVEFAGRPVNTWRYRLAPAPGGGTEVTESFQLDGNILIRAYWALAGHWRSRTNLNGMRTTLERIRDVVEANPAA